MRVRAHRAHSSGATRARSWRAAQAEARANYGVISRELHASSLARRHVEVRRDGRAVVFANKIARPIYDVDEIVEFLRVERSERDARRPLDLDGASQVVVVVLLEIDGRESVLFGARQSDIGSLRDAAPRWLRWWYLARSWRAAQAEARAKDGSISRELHASSLARRHVEVRRDGRAAVVANTIARPIYDLEEIVVLEVTLLQVECSERDARRPLDLDKAGV